MKKFNLITSISLLFFKFDSISSSSSQLSGDEDLIKLFQTSVLLIASNTSTKPTTPKKPTPPITPTVTPVKTTPVNKDIDSTGSDTTHQGPVASVVKPASKELGGGGKSRTDSSKTSSGNGKSGKSAGGKVPIYTMCSRPQSFALTFDDGPSEFSKGLDATLKAQKSHATFFINGFNNGCIYDFADLLLARFKDGNLIGSHTWGHPHLTQGTAEQIHLQLELLEKAMVKILGVKPLWFRPPYGEYNDLVVQVLGERGYKGLVIWSDDSEDSFAAPPTAEKMIAAFNQYPAQSNILCHETKSITTQEAMPTVVKSLIGKGLKLLPIAQCLDISDDPKDWYEYVGEPGTKDATWTCEGTPLPGAFA